MNLSVILATYKRTPLLSRTLESMAKLDSGRLDWELVVADNANDEETRSLVDRFRDSLPVRYLVEEGKGKNLALNRAVKEARGELFVFTDDDVVAEAQANAEASGGSFEISYDMEGAFKDAHVVYPKSWLAKQFFPPMTETPEFDEAQRLYEQYGDWICDERKMKLAHQTAVYMHCLPADPGLEVTEAVMDGPQSVIFDQAENRLHAQKAVMALSMQ